MRGFTLIELAVVITIIGLITGGVLLGVNLLKAAELRGIGSDAEMYISAVNNFQDRYNSLPGDMHNAAHLWGAKAGGGADGLDPACYTFFDPSHTPTRSTCNGNGNGKIAANVASGNDFFEIWQAWQHLANAGMVQGLYTGQGQGNTGFDNRITVPGRSAPRGPVAGEVFTFRWWGTAASVAQVFDGKYDNTLMLGGNTDADDPFLAAADMAAIDTKLDDGKPGTGMVRVYKHSYRPDCATSDVPDSAIYDVVNEKAGCTMVVVTGF